MDINRIEDMIARQDQIKQLETEIDYSKLTQNSEETQQVNMKRFPKFWAEIIKNRKKTNPEALSVTAFAMQAVYEKLKREELL